MMRVIAWTMSRGAANQPFGALIMCVVEQLYCILKGFCGVDCQT